MRMPLTLAIGILCLSMGNPGSTLAAPNPDLDALSQGSVVQFNGTERISQPFVFDLDITTPSSALNFDNIVGRPFQIAAARGRMVVGMIEGIEQIGVSGPQGQYRIRLVPALNRLAYRIANRTFEDMTPVQIISTLLNEAGISGFDIRLNASIPSQELTLQYQESELDFFSRLLEDEGIHYHFETTTSGEKLILGDSNGAFPVLSPGKLIYGTKTSPSITAFSRGQALHSGKVQTGDFNWRIPQANLTATVQTPSFSEFQEDAFPAPVLTPQTSQRFAGLRLGARVTEREVCRGESTYPQLQAGFRFLLVGHPRNDFNQEYVITGVEHQGSSKSYRNTFTCIPANLLFRPSPATPRPVVTGVVPGLVVGPPGEVKYVDQLGRVRVRFPWRNPSLTNKTAGDAGWIRVAQLGTGKGTSAMWIPEIDDEVVVAFEHGDPNRPVVLGNMWNGKDLPPVSQPANKFLSLFQTRSIAGTLNEILFDATKDQERLIFRSGNQYLQLSPQGITASSAITVPTSPTPKLQPAAPSELRIAPRTFPQKQ